MIYRIKLNIRCKGSVGLLLGNIMLSLGFKGPGKKNINPRARFFFTERGWELYGRKTLEVATKLGYEPRIERKKNPKRNQVVYCDQDQVAILPDGDD